MLRSYPAETVVETFNSLVQTGKKSPIVLHLASPSVLGIDIIQKETIALYISLKC